MRTALCAVALLLSVGCSAAHAGPVFTYSGKKFNTGSYLGFMNDFIWASITVQGNDYAGRTLGLSDLSAWSIGIGPDNELRITSDDARAHVKLASFTFDASGALTKWHFDVLAAPPCTAFNCISSNELYTFGNSTWVGVPAGYTRDQAVFQISRLSSGAVANNAGIWTISPSQTIPEPGTWALAALALGLMPWVSLRRRLRS